jgi:ribonuclease HII
MIGIDEVGRGCWAGPLLVVAAKQRMDIDLNLKDSKKLTRPQRESLLPLIVNGYFLGEGWVTVNEVDDLGLTRAMQLGVERALLDINANDDDEIVIDGNINYCSKKYSKSKSVVKADETISSVSAASIYAKVTRDNYMKSVSSKYYGYGFESNVGYGTKKHINALRELGICDIHRKSYKPIAKIIYGK